MGSPSHVIAIIGTGAALTIGISPQLLLLMPSGGQPPEDDHGHGTRMAGLPLPDRSQMGVAGTCPAMIPRPSAGNARATSYPTMFIRPFNMRLGIPPILKASLIIPIQPALSA
jgi:hypothetical protein